MKSVLISIQPKWCELIASGKKTVEVRKTAPKLEPPFKCYIYCTNKKPYLVWGDVFRGGSFENEFTHLSGYNRKAAEEIWDVFNGKVMGEFICNRCEDFTTNYYTMDRPQTLRIARAACLGLHELTEYEGNALCLYGWHISDLVIYDEPKALSEFKKPCDNSCDNCEMLDVQEIGAYENTREIKTCLNRITRPPQSWCYVEGA